MALLGAWLTLVALTPSLLRVYVAAARPVPQGLALTMQQHEDIHGGWDQPKAEAMRRFFTYYPQYRDTATMRERFVWRWYYAFQYLGDQSAAPLAAACAQGQARRHALAQGLAWLSPARSAASMPWPAPTCRHTWLFSAAPPTATMRCGRLITFSYSRRYLLPTPTTSGCPRTPSPAPPTPARRGRASRMWYMHWGWPCCAGGPLIRASGWAPPPGRNFVPLLPKSYAQQSHQTR